ncbi:hypothetical protein Vretimale_17749, partial [Volvox reticuliferus]
MYLAGSPDAWDLLWTFPDVHEANTSSSVLSKPAPVRRVAPTEPIPHHVNASRCRPFGTTKPTAPQLVDALTYNIAAPELVVVGCGGATKPSDTPGRSEVDAGHMTSRNVKPRVQSAGGNDGRGPHGSYAAVTAAQSLGCCIGTGTRQCYDSSGDAASAPTSSMDSLKSGSSVTKLDGDGGGCRVGAENADPKQETSSSVLSADSGHNHLLMGDHTVGERNGEPLPSIELSDGSETTSSNRTVTSIGARASAGSNGAGMVVLASCQATTGAARDELARWISMDVMTDDRVDTGTTLYGIGKRMVTAQQPCYTAVEEPRIPVIVEGAAAAVWGSESLRQFCRNRDPRRQRPLEHQHQQRGSLDVAEQQQQQRLLNSEGLMPAGMLPPSEGERCSLPYGPSRAASGADWPPRAAHALAEAAGGGPLTAPNTPIATTTAAGLGSTSNSAEITRNAATVPPSPVQLQPQHKTQLQPPAVRRGPRTTTSLLLSKVRSVAATAAAAPARAAAAGAGGDLDASAVRFRGGQWPYRRTAAGGCCKSRDSVGGSTRRVTRPQGMRRGRCDHPRPGSIVYDWDMEDSVEGEESDVSSDSSSGGWGSLRCAAALAVEPRGRCRTATSLLEEVQRALAAVAADADADGAGMAAAMAAAAGGGLQRRTAWRLPPLLRGRFDFSTARRRGSHVAAAAAGRRGFDVAEDEAQGGRAPSRSKAAGADEEGLQGGGKRAGGGAAAAAAGPKLSQPPGSSSSSGGGGGGGSDGGPALALLQALDAWRVQRARSVRKTPEALLRLGLLADLAARCPTSVLELEDFPGLPRPFTRRYGQEILDICRNHAHMRAARAAAAAAAGTAGGGDVFRGCDGGSTDAAAAAAQPAVDQRAEEEAADAANTAAQRQGSDDAVGEVLRAHVGDAGRGGGDGGGADSSGGNAVDDLVRVATINRPVGPSVDIAPRVLRMRQQLLNILGVKDGDDDVADRPPRGTMPRRRLSPLAAAGKVGVVANNLPRCAIGVSGSVGGPSETAFDGLATRGHLGNGSTYALDNRTSAHGTGGGGGISGKDVSPSIGCRTSGCRAASPPLYPSGELRTSANVVPTPTPTTAAAAVAAAAANGHITGASIAENAEPKREARLDKAEAEAKLTAGASATAEAAEAEAIRRAPGHKGKLPPSGKGSGYGLSPGKARKRGPSDSPRAAAAAAAAAAAGMVPPASRAMAGLAVPAGWVPLPEGCRARSDRRLAHATTPSLGGAKIKCLLGYLAEAGTAAAPLLESIVPRLPQTPLQAGDVGGTSAPRGYVAAEVTGASDTG